jgi:hypothetical protein
LLFGYRVIRRNGHLRQPHRREGFDRHAFAQKPWERLDANNLGVAWRATRRRLRLWCAGASRQWSALQMLVQSGNLSFEIGYREDFS